ncbi:hypothetical protein VPHD63_0056 [Vibrio phage D63]
MPSPPPPSLLPPQCCNSGNPQIVWKPCYIRVCGVLRVFWRSDVYILHLSIYNMVENGRISPIMEEYETER